MKLKETIEKILGMRGVISSLKTYKGRAALVNQIEGTLYFLQNYKTEESLRGLLVAECARILAEGIKAEAEKYKDSKEGKK